MSLLPTPVEATVDVEVWDVPCANDALEPGLPGFAPTRARVRYRYVREIRAWRFADVEVEGYVLAPGRVRQVRRNGVVVDAPTTGRILFRSTPTGLDPEKVASVPWLRAVCMSAVDVLYPNRTDRAGAA